MEEMLLTRSELARRWKVSIDTLKRRERAKILRPGRLQRQENEKRCDDQHAHVGRPHHFDAAVRGAPVSQPPQMRRHQRCQNKKCRAIHPCVRPRQIQPPMDFIEMHAETREHGQLDGAQAGQEHQDASRNVPGNRQTASAACRG